MPEIAEVEIVKRGLEPLRGQRLLEIDAEEKYFLPDILIGQKLLEIKRHGKLLGFFFEDSIVAAHLRMTGKFLFQEEEKHRRAYFAFEKNELFFHDPRGFARIDYTEIWPGNLGQDLWKIKDGSFLKTDSKRMAKALILDQSKIAGIGNYLADESLYAAGVHPETKAFQLAEKDWRTIIQKAQDLSKQVLKKGGVSLKDYVDTENKKGKGASLLKVYGRSGSPCYNCGEILVKKQVASRGSVFCPRCQVIEPVKE